MTHGYKLDFREKSDVLDFARLLFSGDYDYGYDYGNEFAHTAASFDEKYRPIYRPALIFSDALLFVRSGIIPAAFVARFGRGGCVEENKVKTAAKQNVQKQTPIAGQHYLRENAASRNDQNQHLTRTNDKITLIRRESGKPFLS